MLVRSNRQWRPGYVDTMFDHDIIRFDYINLTSSEHVYDYRSRFTASSTSCRSVVDQVRSDPKCNHGEEWKWLKGNDGRGRLKSYG